jgi:F420-non-reducing hydrogenase iron-sulfur subunit
VQHAKQLIEAIGLQGDRLRMVNLSSAMANKFAEEATAITQVLEELGPSPLHADPEWEGTIEEDRTGLGETA